MIDEPFGVHHALNVELSPYAGVGAAGEIPSEVEGTPKGSLHFVFSPCRIREFDTCARCRPQSPQGTTGNSPPFQRREKDKKNLLPCAAGQRAA
jgi:hypothetical protein